MDDSWDGGSQSTRIFFSWIADRSTESHCAWHVSPVLYACSGETHNLRDARELLIRSDNDGLDEKLVAALGVGRGLLLHRLQQDCEGLARARLIEGAEEGERGCLRLTRHLDFMSGLDASRVRPDAVPAQRVSFGFRVKFAKCPGCTYCFGAVVFTCIGQQMGRSKRDRHGPWVP